MFIWNINKILDSIRNDTFSESDKLKYYIITSLIGLSVASESFDFISNSGIIKIVLIFPNIIIKTKCKSGLDLINTKLNSN